MVMEEEMRRPDAVKQRVGRERGLQFLDGGGEQERWR
jgi:hypothetical protein